MADQRDRLIAALLREQAALREEVRFLTMGMVDLIERVQRAEREDADRRLAALAAEVYAAERRH